MAWQKRDSKANRIRTLIAREIRENGSCEKTNRQLAQACDTSEASVMMEVRRLEDAGIINRQIVSKRVITATGEGQAALDTLLDTETR